MIMLIKSKKIFSLFLLCSFVLIIAFPKLARDGATRGLLISANVIIPSLFPFTVIILMLSRYLTKFNNRLLNKICYLIFGKKIKMFLIFALSIIGGYPIGAKLIGELISRKEIDSKYANNMLIYCVNAGPAFVITAIGCTILNSKEIGIILYCSHIFSSIILAIICGIVFKKQETYDSSNTIPYISSNIFIECVSDATASIIKICSLVIFFSSLNNCIDYVVCDLSILKHITLFTEVTSAVSRYKNIYLISFILGFSGLSIWFQIFSLSNFKINYFKFVLGRILHGSISVVVTKILLQIFKTNVPTYSNGDFFGQLHYNDFSIQISIFVMLIVFFAYIYSKNNTGKIINDMI